MKTLYLLCGMPFSGKTTLGKFVAQRLDSPYISLDEINEARGLYGGDGITIEEWERTHSLAMQQLSEFMQSDKDIVLDDTSCFRWLRDRFRNFSSQYDYQTIIIFLNLSFSEICNRIGDNEKTQIRRNVKQEIIQEMAESFEYPQGDEATIEYDGEQTIEEWFTEHFARRKV